MEPAPPLAAAPAAPAPPPVGASVTTCGELAACWLEPPERPISTPTPIASSSTPTPAITVTVLSRCQRPWEAVLSGAPGGCGGCVGVGGGGPPSSTLLMWARR